MNPRQNRPADPTEEEIAERAEVERSKWPPSRWRRVKPRWRVPVIQFGDYQAAMDEATRQETTA